tara:strand:- start:2289 stop:3428 length:1140 start_codon:yes stop_codon:yes gene_type:complete
MSDNAGLCVSSDEQIWTFIKDVEPAVAGLMIMLERERHFLNQKTIMTGFASKVRFRRELRVSTGLLRSPGNHLRVCLVEGIEAPLKEWIKVWVDIGVDHSISQALLATANSAAHSKAEISDTENIAEKTLKAWGQDYNKISRQCSGISCTANCGFLTSTEQAHPLLRRHVKTSLCAYPLCRAFDYLGPGNSNSGSEFRTPKFHGDLITNTEVLVLADLIEQVGLANEQAIIDIGLSLGTVRLLISIRKLLSGFDLCPTNAEWFFKRMLVSCIAGHLSHAPYQYAIIKEADIKKIAALPYQLTMADMPITKQMAIQQADDLVDVITSSAAARIKIGRILIINPQQIDDLTKEAVFLLESHNRISGTEISIIETSEQTAQP